MTEPPVVVRALVGAHGEIDKAGKDVPPEEFCPALHVHKAFSFGA